MKNASNWLNNPVFIPDNTINKLIFLFMMVLGYGMAKKGIMEEKACSAINWLLVIPLAAMPVIRLVTSNVTMPLLFALLRM